MQPSPDDFNLTLGDINVEEHKPKQREAWKNANNKGLKEFEFMGRKYRTSEMSTGNRKFIGEMELKSEQKFPNGLIMKMFEYD
jgi:hypothetical protein